MNHLKTVIVATLLAAPVSRATAAPAPARLFASESGATGLKVIPDATGQAAVGELFDLDQDGNEKVIWRKTLLRRPEHVLMYADLTGRHFVVTYGKELPLGPSSLNNHGHLVFDERSLAGLTIYGAGGVVVKDFAPAAEPIKAVAGPLAPATLEDWAKTTYHSTVLSLFGDDKTPPALTIFVKSTSFGSRMMRAIPRPRVSFRQWVIDLATGSVVAFDEKAGLQLEVRNIEDLTRPQHR